MAKALWHGVVIAESEDVVLVENNRYFPLASVKQEYLRPSDTTSVCGWKGTASYYTIDVNGDVNEDAAWTYPDPKPQAAQIKDRVAFWKGVQFED